jgi:hypothetical protein
MHPKSLLAAAGLCAALGSHAAWSAEKEEAGKRESGGMTMMDMMDKSDMSCMSTRDSLESLARTVQEALKSDDKAKMKAALQLADAHFAQMRSHMSTCMDMMNRMGGMMGGKAEGGMGMGEKKPGEAKPAAEKGSSPEHEKHHPK